MAFVAVDVYDEEIWRRVSADWYCKRSDGAPELGRLYHHLGLLFCCETTRALYFFTKSTCVATPFFGYNTSILALFRGVLNRTGHDCRDRFVIVHNHLFAAHQERDLAIASGQLAEVTSKLGSFLSHLDKDISRKAKNWLRTGSEIAISNCNALLQYGERGNPIISHLMAAATGGLPYGQNNGDLAIDSHYFNGSYFSEAQALAHHTDEIVFARFGDPNILPYVHVRLAFMVSMVRIPTTTPLCDNFNWHLLTCVLNSTLDSLRRDEEIAAMLPGNGGQDRREQPLPEDWDLRGLLWTRELFAKDHFHEADQDKRKLEMEEPSCSVIRKRRVINLGNSLAAQGKWLAYNHEASHFVVSTTYEKASVTELFAAYHDEPPLDALEWGSLISACCSTLLVNDWRGHDREMIIVECGTLSSPGNAYTYCS
jgi:hypothetical protein